MSSKLNQAILRVAKSNPKFRKALQAEMGKQAMYRDAIWQGRTEYWYLEAYVDDVDIDEGETVGADSGYTYVPFDFSTEGIVRIVPPKNWSWPTPLIKWKHTGVGAGTTDPNSRDWEVTDRGSEKYMIVSPAGRGEVFKPKGWLKAWLGGYETRPPGIVTTYFDGSEKGQQIAKVKIGATPVLTLEDSGYDGGSGQLVWRFDSAGKALQGEIPVLFWEREERNGPVQVEFSGGLTKRPNSKLVKFIQEQVTKNLR
jgi:hypothetical protein